MAITIYGSARSRTMRVLWMAAEVGLEYRHVPLAWDAAELKSSDFLAMNPAGAIPVLVDGDVVLSESLAINLYLAKTHGGSARLYPESAAGEAEAWRWTLWAQGQMEPWVQRDHRFLAMREAAHAVFDAEVQRGLAELERWLATRDWLVENRFTVADLNVAAVLSPSRAGLVDFAPHTRVAGWLARCYARPAAVETRRRFL